MQQERLQSILAGFGDLRIGVLGDFCIDAYWLIDKSRAEISVETGRSTCPVRRQEYNLGGAGNVAKNLAEIGVGQVRAFSVIGNDLFGREMLNLLSDLGVKTDGMIIQDRHWDTPVYAKPHIELQEQDRLDFGNFNRISSETADLLLERLAETMGELDGLIVNQQLAHGIHSEHMIVRLGKLIGRFDEKIILLDARDVPDRYDRVICKINASEAAKLCGASMQSAHSVADLRKFARKIHARTARPVIITRSERGMLAADGDKVHEVPGIRMIDRIDPVGAGDTAAAAIVSALAAGAGLDEAIELGNYAAAVVVKKLRQTGTASPREIVKTAAESEYLYRPELAEDARAAKFWHETEIELINPAITFGGVKHVLFDHDGTISTLREGWEQIMAPVMLRSILGEHYDDAPSDLYRRVADRVAEYIDRSTGIETIVQMQGLVGMVQEFGLVEPGDILEPMAYKQIFNRALMEKIDRRIEKLNRGELAPEDYTIKGAVELLGLLYRRGVKLYLASGTDHDDVVREAKILGYADCFEGRIFGWAGQGTGSAKRIVIERIIREHRLQGSELACIGDGPVELRLCKQAGGIAVGIASDEVCRYGPNPVKRTRLIKAGADLIVPDFTQRESLIDLLFNQQSTVS